MACGQPAAEEFHPVKLSARKGGSLSAGSYNADPHVPPGSIRAVCVMKDMETRMRQRRFGLLAVALLALTACQAADDSGASPGTDEGSPAATGAPGDRKSTRLNS